MAGFCGAQEPQWGVAPAPDASCRPLQAGAGAAREVDHGRQCCTNGIAQAAPAGHPAGSSSQRRARVCAAVGAGGVGGVQRGGCGVVAVEGLRSVVGACDVPWRPGAQRFHCSAAQCLLLSSNGM